MIPKVIHYCWFGGNPKPEIVEKCIASWKRFCPDWEIKEWTETNYDVSAHPYTKEAYEAKKWAFVSDIARLDIVFKEGGVYLDTDVELLSPLDAIIDCEAFYSFETNLYVNSGQGFGAIAGHSSLASMLAVYEGACFIKNGEPDMSPCPAKNTDGLINSCPQFRRNGKTQRFDGVVVLSTGDYLRYARHHVSGSWVETPSSQRVFRDTKIKRLLRTPQLIDKIGDLFGQKVEKAYIFLVYDLWEYGVGYFWKKLIKKLKRN